MAALALPFLYNLLYDRKGLAFCFLVLTAIPHFLSRMESSSLYLFGVWTSGFLSLILAFYSGLTGNRAAFKARNYENEEDFIRSQRFWVPITVIAIIVHFYIFPSQITGHINSTRMIKLNSAKENINYAIQRGAADNGEIPGINVKNADTPFFFAKYMYGNFDGVSTITGLNGETYFFRALENDCGTVEDNTFYGEKTACAVITVDLNGKKGPNYALPSSEVKGLSRALNKNTRLADTYTFYLYNDGVKESEGSVEQYVLKKFER